MPPSRSYSRLDRLQPGDVVVVRTNSRLFGPLIRLGAALVGKPDQDDHVAVLHHHDSDGTPWGLEARPGDGIGWVDLREYDNRWLAHNAAQPKTGAQRQQVVELAREGLHHVTYDWRAIGHDVVAVLHLGGPDPEDDFSDVYPRHAVCSSWASWLYLRAGLARPPAVTRWTIPGDWRAFIDSKDWTRHDQAVVA